MAIAGSSDLPLAVYADSASPHEVTLVLATIDEFVTVGRQRQLIGIVLRKVDRSIESWLSRTLN